MISTCFVNIYNFNSTIFILFGVKKWEIRTFDTCKYAISLLKTLTLGKALHYKTWVPSLNKNRPEHQGFSAFFHPSPSEGWIQHLYLQQWGQLNLKRCPRSRSPAGTLCYRTADFSEVPHSSKACHHRYRKITA